MRTELAMNQLVCLDEEARRANFEQVLRDALRAGIPPEVLTRLEGLWGVTRRICGHSIRIGRIVVLRIMEFIKANPHMAAGAAMWAVVGFLAASAVPLIGSMLAPLVAVLGALYGAGRALSLRSGGDGSMSESAIALARAFVEVLQSIQDGVVQYVEEMVR